MNIVGKHVHDVKHFQERKNRNVIAYLLATGFVCISVSFILLYLRAACNVIVICDLGFVFCIFFLNDQKQNKTMYDSLTDLAPHSYKTKIQFVISQS